MAMPNTAAETANPAHQEPAEPMDLPSEIEDKLQSLYDLKDTYTIEQKIRTKKITKQVNTLLELIEQAIKGRKELGVSPAQCMFWKGKALDAYPEYKRDAEQALQKAVKLQPGFIEAWNLLANVFWKKQDLEGAKNCLTQALEQKKTVESLRSLSMIVKNMGDQKERPANVDASVAHAKEAIGLNIKDGESWYVLGNALLAQFFVCTHEHKTLMSALKAYTAAESSEENSAATNPDLYYNRANVYKFFEDYQKAIEGYERALELDPSLPAQDEIEALRRFVHKMYKLISTQANIKPKRMKSLTKAINTQATILERGNAVMSELKVGGNRGKIVLGVVIAPVTRESDIPVSLLVADRAGEMFVISLYNVTGETLDQVKVDDVVAVTDPMIKVVALSENSSEVQYRTIQVTTVNAFFVNGRNLRQTNFAHPEMEIRTFA